MARSTPPGSETGAEDQHLPALSSQTAPSTWLPGIEALRGLAALTVVAHHCWSLSDQPRFPGYQIIEGLGTWGVNLFFLLSGFLLAEYFWRPGKASLRDYYLRRIFRIAPAYYVNVLVLFVFFADHALLFSRIGARQVAANLTFTQWLSPRTSSNLNVNGTLWTLTIEMMLYAVMPVLATMIRRSPALFGGGLVALSVGYRLVVARDGDVLTRWWFGSSGPADDIQRLYLVRQFPGILAIFVIGMVSRHYYLRWEARQSGAGREWSLLLLAALLIPSLALLLNVERASQFRHWVWFVGFDIAVVVLALPPLLYASRPVRRALGRPTAIAVWFGKRSYGIYLWHFPIILSVYGRGVTGAAPTLTHWWARLLFIFAASIAFGAASYRMIEHPAREWGRHLAVRVSRRSEAIPPGGIA